MKKTFSQKKSAFSLIELSIVLIIIGLLIAGITGGASLIKSSELRSVITEARVYGAAVNNFYSRYNALPGDFTTAVSPSDVIGDGDGKIEHYAEADTTDIAEGAEALRDLQTLGAIGDDALTIVAWGAGSTTTVPAMAVRTNIPASKIKSGGWAFDYNTNDSQNVAVLTGNVSASNGTNTIVNGQPVASAVILATDALSIDAKIDDAVPTSGKVRGVNIGADTTCVNTTYQISETSKTCALSYQVDVNS